MVRMAGNNIYIFGAGGSGREVAWLIQDKQKKENTTSKIFFVDDNKHIHGKKINNIIVQSWDNLLKDKGNKSIIIALGDPIIRKKIVEKCLKTGLKFSTEIHPSVIHSSFVKINEGSIICANSVLTVNINIGKHVHINLDCTISHDVTIGDYTTISCGVHVSGRVDIGKGVYIGAGVNIINGIEGKHITIGDGAIIGAGACVTKDIPPNTTAVGVPAKIIKTRPT